MYEPLIRAFDVFPAEDRINNIGEFTEILLHEVPLPQSTSLFFQELGGDARAVIGRDADAFPIALAAPRIMEPIPLTEGSGQRDQMPA